MPRSILLQLSRLGAPPFQGSVGYVNNGIAAVLARNGFEIRRFDAERSGTPGATLPLGRAAQFAADLGRGPADIAIHDDEGAALRIPSRRWAERNIVLYHGLAYGAGAWMANPEIDLHCANSRWLARVLISLFAFPDWLNRRCLNADALTRVTDFQLPVPCVEFPEGDPRQSAGADVLPEVMRMLDGPLIVGHALQSRKQDWLATLGVIYWLNELARANGTRRVLLLVPGLSLDPRTRQALDALLAPTGGTCGDFFVPLPHLNQQALFKVMRGCRFGLAYNHFPEPFGFQVLESVHNGCPVYTNGIGNNRFLLPPGHGIVVQETAEMVATPEAPASIAAWRPVAESIHADLAQPARRQSECRRGAGFIESTWSPARSEQSLLEALDRAEGALPPAPPFEEMRVDYSPLVRHLEASTGRLLDDYGNDVLGADAVRLLQDLAGNRCADLASADMQRIEQEHGFFRRGILTLRSPHLPHDV